MDDKDQFAVWLAAALLQARDDEFGAEALSTIAANSPTSEDFHKALKDSASTKRRAGDFGIEFIGPLLPVIFVEFGRLLWDAYAKSLVDEGGKALAKATVDQVKTLLQKTFTREPGALSLSEVETRLRTAATKAGLDDATTDELVGSLRRPETADVFSSA